MRNTASWQPCRRYSLTSNYMIVTNSTFHMVPAGAPQDHLKPDSSGGCSSASNDAYWERNNLNAKIDANGMKFMPFNNSSNVPALIAGTAPVPNRAAGRCSSASMQRG